MRLRLISIYLIFMIVGICSADEPGPGTVNQRTGVARSDLVYDRPAATPDEGQPIGNGRMGTMVWTSPNAIHLQINRVDVFAVNRDHLGAQFSATDYCGGIASIVIQVGGEPFGAGDGNVRQQLSLENAECIVETADFVARMYVSAGTDVLVLEIDDRRASPQPLKAIVSMLRQPELQVGDNVASTNFVENPRRIVLQQRFRERDFHNASAIVVGLPESDAAANDAVRIDSTSATTRTLILPPAQGKRVILISS
ncbi:MAG: glycoside hydrolase N-terminal domain-containing protein, partial [Planctomycetaceae bacterium]